MNRRTSRVLLTATALALALASSGCRFLKKKPAPAASTTAAATAATAAAASTAQAPAASAEPAADLPDDAIATTEDFEEEAFAKISDKTYKTDLESLKREIESEE